VNIGFASIFAFRPHVEHIWYLAHLLKAAGHRTFFFTCDAALELCYPRALKGTPKAIECPTCMLGGIRSYATSNISSIARGHVGDPGIDLVSTADSSICTVLRTETTADLQSPAALELRAQFLTAAQRAFRSGLDWIRRNELEGVICFNGRMDATRALTLACTHAGIPFITLERTWFGDGLQLIPNADCLSLSALKALNRFFRDTPLTRSQGRYVGRLLASRFLGRNQKEWRAYNLNPTPASWPISPTKRKVLLLPSSRCEFQVHPDWQLGWEEATDAFDWLFATLTVRPEDVVLRCHPNWAERIGRATGSRAHQHYTTWSARRGTYCITSDQKCSTFDLIEASDMVVVNGSTVAFEAAALGKPVICMGSSHYMESGVALHVCSPEDINILKELEYHDRGSAARASLRFGYTITRRFAQFARFVRCITPTQYEYFGGADAERIIRMLRTGTIEPDDAVVASDCEGERAVLSLVESRRWQELHDVEPPKHTMPGVQVRRRRGLGWLDGARGMLPEGDRL
jgi:hypothetical protein